MNSRRSLSPRYDVARIFPALQPLARPAIRLHPRRGTADDAVLTRMGGNFHWDAGEKWPRCRAHKQPYAAILQIHQSDVPDFPFEPGTDLFQLLWCPGQHGEEGLPLINLHWRKTPDSSLEQTPAPDGLDEDIPYLPYACTLAPERVIEYPGFDDLPPDLQAAIKAWDLTADPVIQERLKSKWSRSPFRPGEELYRRELSNAAGTKLGGWPDWIQFPDWPKCGCGRRTEHLLTIASLENFDDPRWCPIEDQPLAAKAKDDYEALLKLNHQLGIDIRDGGNVYIFFCRHCADWPWQVVSQCG